MTPSQIVRKCWAEELKAAGKATEGRMLDEMVIAESRANTVASRARSGVKRTTQSGYTRVRQERMLAWMKYLRKKGVGFEIGTEESLLQRELAAKEAAESQGIIWDGEPADGLFDPFWRNPKTGKEEATIFLDEEILVLDFYEECYHALQHLGDFPEFGTIGGIEGVDLHEFHAKMRILLEGDYHGLEDFEMDIITEDLVLVLKKEY